MTTGITIINNERVYHDFLSVSVNNSRRGIKSGCAVTEKSGTPDMSVDVASGIVYFGTTEVVVSGTNIVIGASDPSNDRFDLVVVNISGTISVIDGTSTQDPSDPRPPAFDTDTYVLLARVRIDDGATSILDANIKDLRVILEYPAAGIGKDLTTFTNSSYIEIAHSLNDSKPLVQVYDSEGNQFTPDTIEIVDANNVVVSFTSVTSGTVVIHGGEGATPTGIGDIIPAANNTYDIGSSSYKWKDLYLAGALNLSGNLSAVDGTFTGDVSAVDLTLSGNVKSELVPDANNTYDLGSSGNKFKDGYFAGDVSLSTINTYSPAGFSNGSDVFTSSTDNVTIINAFCNANSLVTIVIDSTTSPVGVWSVNSESGQFVVTSDSTETTAIDFDYYIQRAI